MSEYYDQNFYGTRVTAGAQVRFLEYATLAHEFGREARSTGSREQVEDFLSSVITVFSLNYYPDELIDKIARALDGYFQVALEGFDGSTTSPDWLRSGLAADLMTVLTA